MERTVHLLEAGGFGVDLAEGGVDGGREALNLGDPGGDVTLLGVPPAFQRSDVQADGQVVRETVDEGDSGALGQPSVEGGVSLGGNRSSEDRVRAN